VRKCSAAAVAIVVAFTGGFMAGRGVPAQAQGKARVFEIRTYTAESKAGLDALVSRMGKGELKAFERAGMTNVGHFVATEAPKSENTYVYILAHEDMEKAKASWQKIRGDQEFLQLIKTAPSPGPIKVESVYVSPTDFSPLK
jgi:hypothetical protein